MKINDINRIQAIQKYQLSNQQERELKQKEAKKDQLFISNEAKVLLEQSKDTSGASTEKVERLKEQVENGTYQIDPQKIADKLMKTMLKE